MSNANFLERIQAGEILISDGATGTNLQARGLPIGQPSDVWVLENPQEVIRLHRDFIAAGSNIILTNTFGGSRTNLSKRGLTDKVAEMNRRAVELARIAAEGTQTLVAGSMGPLGEMLQPFGTLEESDAQASYAEQAQTLTEAGVDLLVIETQFDLNEAAAAVRGARSASSLPLVVSFSFDRGKRSMMGVKPSQVAEQFADMQVNALGINCGKSLEDNFSALKELRAATQLPIWFKPNAGMPHSAADGSTYFDFTPDQMAEHAADWIAAGAQIIGGCCGTSPEHLGAVARAVRKNQGD